MKVSSKDVDLMNMFRAKIDIYDFKKYIYTCVYFPETVLKKLPLDQHLRLRINATIDGLACKGALMPDKAGSKQTDHLLKDGYVKDQKVWYFQVPKKLLNRLDKQVGDVVEVDFEIADQSEVEVHPAVEELLANDEDLRVIWEGLTAGKKRSLMYPILAAKTNITLEKRMLAFVDQLTEL